MAARHRSSSLLLRRSASDTAAAALIIESPSLSSSLLGYPIGRFDRPAPSSLYHFPWHIFFLSPVRPILFGTVISFSLFSEKMACSTERVRRDQFERISRARTY